MRPQLTQQDILAALVAETRNVPDHPITAVTQGVCLTAVESQFCGLASLVSHIAPSQGRFTPADGMPATAHQAAADLLRPDTTNTDAASLAMAAINSLLPPPPEEASLAGQDIILQQGRGKNVAVIGHFPFVDAMRQACANFWVLEKRPKPGDVDASQADVILPQADLVAITGTTLLNGTLAGLLNLCRPDAFVVMLGPTTPYAASLFACGIDVLAGSAVTDVDTALAGIRSGKCFKHLGGVRQTAWLRPGRAA